MSQDKSPNLGPFPLSTLITIFESDFKISNGMKRKLQQIPFFQLERIGKRMEIHPGWCGCFILDEPGDSRPATSAEISVSHGESEEERTKANAVSPPPDELLRNSSFGTIVGNAERYP